MPKKGFRTLDDKMQADIILWADQGLSGNRIHAELVKKYKDRAPTSRQTIYNFLRSVRDRETPECWSLGTLADPDRSGDLNAEEAALVLRVLRRVHRELEREYGREHPVRWAALTADVMPVDVARWIARLGRIAPQADLLQLYSVACLYAGRERLARAQGDRFDSRDLDAGIDPDSEHPFAELATAWARSVVPWAIAKAELERRAK